MEDRSSTPEGLGTEPEGLGTDAAAEGAGLVPRIYAQLHQLASRLMQNQRVDHTLQPTALVHEAWLKIANNSSEKQLDRTAFFGLAARSMR